MARWKPRTRRAASPTSTATAPVTAAATSAATKKWSSGRASVNDASLTPIPMSRPATSAAAVSPPIPARAAWPSEICPVHPESTTKESPIRANSSTSLNRIWREAWVSHNGRTAAAATSRPMPIRDEWRTHQSRATAFGSGRVVGTKEKDSSVPADRLLAARVAAMTITNSAASYSPALVGQLNTRNERSTPRAIPETSAAGKLRSRPMRAAARTWTRVAGPSERSPVGWPLMPATRISATADSRPAMIQVIVEAILGLMAVRRARSGLDAAARMARPCAVRWR